MWRRFWSVTLPQLRPVIVAITSLDFVWNINQFAMVYALTQGGPGGRTRLPMLFAYEEAFRYGFFGYAAALGVAITIVVLAVLGFYLWRQMRETDPMKSPLEVRSRSLGYLVFLAFPLLWLLSTSFKTQREMANLHPRWIPHHPTLRNFTDAFSAQDPAGSALRSLVVAVSVAVIVGGAGAARGVRPGAPRSFVNRVAIGWVLVSQVFPVMLIIIPLFMILRRPGPGEHPARPGRGARDVHAAVRAVDAPGLRARRAARAGGRGGRRRRRAGADPRTRHRAAAGPRRRRHAAVRVHLRRGTSSSSPS